MKDNVKVSMTIIFIITIIILSIIPLTVQSDATENPYDYEFINIPNNSFGIGDHYLSLIHI